MSKNKKPAWKKIRNKGVGRGKDHFQPLCWSDKEKFKLSPREETGLSSAQKLPKQRTLEKERHARAIGMKNGSRGKGEDYRVAETNSSKEGSGDVFYVDAAVDAWWSELRG